MIDVVALGELLIDFTCVSTDEDGYPTMSAHPGGAPSNFLATLSKFGMKTAFLGKVGSDAFGKMLSTTLEQAGIETRGIIETDDVFTTIAFVTVDKNGERDFSFARKPGADTRIRFEELDLSLIDEAKIFHFGSLSLTDEPARTATRRAVAYAKKKGKAITFDPNLRKPLWKDLNVAKKQMIWGLEKADVVKISDEEIDFLFGLPAEAGARYLIDHFPVKLVFVTCGANGSYFRNSVSCGFVPALNDLIVKDTTGAGDIFGGAAVWKLLQSGKDPSELDELTLRDAALFATTAAGLSVTKSGGITGIPELNCVIKEMNRRNS